MITQSWTLTGGYTTDPREIEIRSIVHALPLDSNQAICGQRPTRKSNGWVEAMVDGRYDKNAPITCPACLVRISKPTC